MTTTPTTIPQDELETDLSGLGKARTDTLDDLGIYLDKGTYYHDVTDNYGRIRRKAIAQTTDPAGTLEGYILKEMGKQVDLVDLTQHRSHDQIIQLLDSHTETHADLESFNYSPASEAPFDSMEKAFADITRDPGKYLGYLGEPNLPTTFTPNGNSIEFTPLGGGKNKRVPIHDIIIRLFQEKLVYNKEIGEYLYGRVSRERRIEREKARQERIAAKTNGGITGTTSSPNTAGIGSNILFETQEELSVPQIYAACEQAQKKPTQGSAYSFDKKWFQITYDSTKSKKFSAKYQKDSDGNTSITKANTIGEIIANISSLSKKKEAKKDSADTVDMGKDFDENKFTELCNTIKKSSKTVGYYIIGGKQYKISLLPADPTATPPTGEGYRAEFPGRLDKENHTEVSSGVLKDNAQSLAHHIAEEIHVHEHTEGHHDVSYKDLKDFIKTKVDNHSENHPKEYDVGGKKIKIWRQKGFSMKANSNIPLPSLALYKMRYYAEIPGTIKPLSDTTPEGLAKQIIKKVGTEHTEHKKDGESHEKSEGKEKSSEEGHEKKGDHKEGHPEQHHTEEGGTVYSKVVSKLFGNGLVGKMFKGPPYIRGVTGTAFDATVASTVVGGGLYLTSAAIGSVALSTLIVPAMTTAFLGYGLYSATKRFKKWRASKGGGESKESHGGH